MLKKGINELVPEHRSEQLFSNYEKQFTSAGLSDLRSIGGGPSEDSKFVLTGMRYLYRFELHRLSTISVTGGSKNKNKDVIKTNEKMSPKKVDAIKGVFAQRLDILRLVEKEHKQRAARVNMLINNATSTKKTANRN